MRHLSKIISVVMTVVLMASLFAMLGGFTASAETYGVYQTMVNLTFDGDAPYGIPAHRKISGVTYMPDEGYVKITNLAGNGSMAFFGKDGTVGQTPINHSSSAEAEEAAYNDLFIFGAAKTYRVTFRYKYLAGTQLATQAVPAVALFTNPLEDAADPNRTFEDRVNVITKTLPWIKWTLNDEGVLAEDTDWAKAELVFTTNDDEQGFAFGMYGYYHATGDIYCAVDDFKVEEVLTSFEYRETAVYTMDDEPTYTNASSAPGSYVTDSDETHGKVLMVSGSATSSRGGFKNDDFNVTYGNKYYVSFDAKSDSENTDLLLAISNFSNTTGCRYFICGYNDNPQGVQYFIDGGAISVKQASTSAPVAIPVSTEWQHYGFVIDTADADFLARVEAAQAQVLTNTCHFMFGASATTYFDNMRVVELSTVSDAVPEAVESVKYSVRDEKQAADNGGVYQSAGLRFRGDVTNTEKEAADEIGFLIAPSGQVYGDADWYDIANGVSSVAKKAVCYRKNGIDVAYAVGTDTTSYQLILTNLSNEQGGNLYARRFAAVMYVKTGDTYTYYSLGEISYNQVKAEYAVRGY